jgi:hypothetical protein
VTLIARVFAFAGLTALLVGMPVAAWVVTDHWLGPLVVFVLAVGCLTRFMEDWER